MDQAEFRARTKKLALRVMRLVDGLPRTQTGDVIGRQLLKSATSVGANYRAACRARSNAEFLAKMGIVEEEADECAFWIELLIEGHVVKASRLSRLHTEINEITAMTVASIQTARRRRS
jgi:four helix bundle protein